MNGMRWTTGIGIALGGTGGAIAALMGAPQPPEAALPTPVVEEGVEAPKGHGVEGESAPASAADTATLAVPASAAAAAPASASVSPPASAPALALPTTREALLKAELYCDQRKDFDECTRAAQALETGSAGPADPQQAKRFRKIALTYLVRQCEAGGSPHACFVLAAKYRAGTELAQNPTGADALEKRALELCRFRSAPECPAP